MFKRKDAASTRRAARLILACGGWLAVAPQSTLFTPEPVQAAIAPAQVAPGDPPQDKPLPDNGESPDASREQDEDPVPPALEPSDLPDLDQAVQALLDAEYLTETERTALRVRHGVWTDGDLITPAHRCEAAIIRGAFGDACLDDPHAPRDLRAEAALSLGHPERVFELVGADPTLRVARLKAEAFIQLGKRDEAEALLLPLVDRVRDPGLTDADEVAEGVRAMLLLARLRGAESPRVIGYQELLGILGHARDAIDRLSWRVSLAEALLLHEKGMLGESAQALEGCLHLNPRCAEAWHLLGRLSAMTFSFDDAERTALRLDALASEGQSSTTPSVWAALVRAHAKVRQNEGALAAEALAPAVAALPMNRALRAMEAAASAVSFDFERTDQLLADYDALSPGAPEAYLEVGRALADARQYEEAAGYLRTAGERWPLWAEPRVELGLLQLQAGQLEEAGDALDAALLLDRHHARAKNSQTLLRELETYEVVESEHFTVRYKPGPDAAMAAEMLPALERIFARVTGDDPGGIRHAPAGKTVVELYPNHRWFAVRIAGMPSLHTFAAATGPVIAMEAPRGGPGHLVGPYDWARVVQHEYTHTVTLSRTKNRLPHWFTEAGAVYLEDAPRDWNTVQLLARVIDTESLFDFDTISIMFTRPRRPTDRAQAYAQGAWMYEYMIEKYGPEAPLELMDLYAAGVREPEGFKRVFKLSREEFLSDFTAWAQDEIVEWGMAPREGQSRIAELLAADEADEPTPDLIQTWRQREPGNPFVLALAVRELTKRDRAEWTADDTALLAEYAAARPVDPLPHRELAAYCLAGLGGKSPTDAIPHLEFLDAREQHTPAYALELARRYGEAGRWDDALAKARRASQISPYDGTVRESAATLAVQAGNLEEAERQIVALTIIEPDRVVHKQRLEAVRARMK